MSLLLEQRLDQIVSDFDGLIIKCTTWGLPEVALRLVEIREAIAKGLAARRELGESRPQEDRK